MSSLLEIAKEIRDVIVNGFGNCIIRKEGRAWICDGIFWEDDELNEAMTESLKKDKYAVSLNGYYYNFGIAGDGNEKISIRDLASKIKWHYELNKSRQMVDNFTKYFNEGEFQ